MRVFSRRTSTPSSRPAIRPVTAMSRPASMPAKAPRTVSPKFTKTWGGYRMRSLGYYGDTPNSVSPTEPSWIDSLTSAVNTVKPTITSGRKLIQAVRGPRKTATAPSTPQIPVTGVRTGGESRWMLYGVGAIVLAGGAAYLLLRK